jgi:hypothetical protein
VVRWRPVRRACRMGIVPLVVELIEGRGAGVNGSPRGHPDAAGLEDRVPGWAGLPPGCPRTPERSRVRDGGRQPGITDWARIPAGGRTPVNVAVEPAGAGPGSPDIEGCGCPVSRTVVASR